MTTDAEIRAAREQADAMLEAADELFEAHPDRALAAYDAVLDRFHGATDDDLRTTLVYALQNKSILLRTLDRDVDALRVLLTLVQEHYADPPAAAFDIVVECMGRAGSIMVTLGHLDQAIALYDDLAEQYGGPDDPGARGTVALALVGRGWALSEASRWDEALATYEQLLAHLGPEPEGALRLRHMQALSGRAYVFAYLRRTADAIADHETLLRTFAEGEDPETDQRLAESRVALAELRAAG